MRRRLGSLEFNAFVQFSNLTDSVKKALSGPEQFWGNDQMHLVNKPGLQILPYHSRTSLPNIFLNVRVPSAQSMIAIPPSPKGFSWL
jgi:hypothetical protein